MSTQYLAPGTGPDGTQLWIITINDDGTSSAKELVNLYPAKSLGGGIGSASPSGFTRVGHGFIFAASGSADESKGANYGRISSGPGAILTGREFWYSDGTAAGTHLLVDVNKRSDGGPGDAFTLAQSVALSPGAALFLSTDASNKHHLYVTAGTNGSTTDVSGPAVLYTYETFFVVNGRALFAAGNVTSPSGRYLFSADGKVGGTRQIGTEQNLTVIGSVTQTDGTQEALISGLSGHLSSTDGVTVTSLLDRTTNLFTPLDLGTGQALVLGKTADTTFGLYTTDGTAANTRVVKTFSSGNVQLLRTELTDQAGVHKGFLKVFDAASSAFQLWVTDGTQAGTARVSTTDRARDVAVVGTHLLFTADDGNGNTVLDSTDGTTVTRLAASGVYSGTSAFLALPGVTVFQANNQVYVTDGTVGGTKQVSKNLRNIGNLTVVGSHVLFESTARGTTSLWTGDASGNAVKLDLGGIAPLDANGNPVVVSVTGAEGFFTTTASDGTTATWATDGTQAGTHIVSLPAGTSVNVAGLSPTALPCFLAGTPILTTRGEVAVEDLAVGDLVLTLSGAGSPLKPVRWIGRSAFDTARHPHPEQVTPIRIAADALGERLPHRDLLVSPGHSLLIDGVLLQAERLLNGATITRDRAIPRGTYFHVEVEGHDILLSAGVPSESFLDTGNRAAFNQGDVVDLHPDFSPKHWTETCVPLVQDGPVLAAVRARLLARAFAAGFATTAESGLHVLADGVVVAASEASATSYRFAVPAGARDVMLVSRGFVPTELEPESADTRCLGVFVGRLVVDGDDLLPDGVRDGWYGIERHGGVNCRWTNGQGRLPSGSTDVTVQLVSPRRYWQHASVAVATPASMPKAAPVVCAAPS